MADDQLRQRDQGASGDRPRAAPGTQGTGAEGHSRGGTWRRRWSLKRKSTDFHHPHPDVATPPHIVRDDDDRLPSPTAAKTPSPNNKKRLRSPTPKSPSAGAPSPPAHGAGAGHDDDVDANGEGAEQYPGGIEAAGPEEDEDGEFSLDEVDDDTSITSSVHRHTFKNGRRYHKFRHGRYPIPNDEREQNREDMLHAMMLEATNGKYFYAPIAENPSKILDLGTGTGIWAVESESAKMEENVYRG